MGVTFPLSQVDWAPCWRIIPSRFPPIGLFDRVAAPEDLEAIFALEAMTNPRLREEAGNLTLVPPEDRVSGPGTTPIMAAFTHLNPEGSRFSDGSFGVHYAARNLETAVAETRYHRECFLRATREGHQELDMRVYLADLSAALHDLRGLRDSHPALLDPDSYLASQHLAVSLRKVDADGIVYDSARHSGGECVAVFRPRLLTNCRQEKHLCYVWDGERVSMVYEKRAFDAPPRE